MYPKQALSLFNSHPLMDGAVPLLPLQVEVGCMSCRPVKPIKDKLMMDFLTANDSRPIVLFSLGSFQQPGRIPQEYVDVLFDAFELLPQYRFLAKLPPRDRILAPHVLTSMWVPQQDVLGLAETRLFISHCGRQSISQALYHGVPMLGLPIAFDQPRHCRKMEHKQYAVVLQWEEITPSSLAQHIDHMITNTTYRDRVLRVSQSIKAEKETGLERAVRYIEYTVEHDTDLLQYSGLHLNLWQYLLLDVVAIIAVVLTLLLSLTYLLVRRVCRAVWGKLKPSGASPALRGISSPQGHLQPSGAPPALRGAPWPSTCPAWQLLWSQTLEEFFFLRFCDDEQDEEFIFNTVSRRRVCDGGETIVFNQLVKQNIQSK
ncbi:UDP-glucuronosyl/UDP-glucosyltransferase [Trinorchestia longiramus]|nr:UDP-glucuronosyl/UDP-glucosyltransferase [Trinorchestia longiramus]